MKVSDAFPSKWLKASDLDDQDMTVTIKSAVVQMIGQGEDQQQKLVLFFQESEKGLVLNKTNAGIIERLHGGDTDHWIGKRVTLWPNHDVQFGSEVVSAIRVRSRAPGAANGNGHGSTGAGNGNVLRYKDAVALCEAKGLTEQNLKDYLGSCGVKGWTPETAQQCSDLTRTYVAGVGVNPPLDDDMDSIPF